MSDNLANGSAGRPQPIARPFAGSRRPQPAGSKWRGAGNGAFAPFVATRRSTPAPTLGIETAPPDALVETLAEEGALEETTAAVEVVHDEAAPTFERTPFVLTADATELEPTNLDAAELCPQSSELESQLEERAAPASVLDEVEAFDRSQGSEVATSEFAFVQSDLSEARDDEFQADVRAEDETPSWYLETEGNDLRPIEVATELPVAEPVIDEEIRNAVAEAPTPDTNDELESAFIDGHELSSEPCHELTSEPCQGLTSETGQEFTTEAEDSADIQFDNLASTEPAALITDLTGTADVSEATNRVAFTLERLATRIRNGEIPLGHTARAGSDTAVLASVLSTLLSDSL